MQTICNNLCVARRHQDPFHEADNTKRKRKSVSVFCMCGFKWASERAWRVNWQQLHY